MASSKSLIAVLLVTRTRPGQKVAFCYPPNQRNSNTHDNDEDGQDSDSNSDSEGTSMPTPLRRIMGNQPDFKDDKASTSTEANGSLVEPEGLFGFSEESIEKLLSPNCWTDRKKFEYSLHGITFVSHPIFSATDESWNHKHSHDTTPKKDRQAALSRHAPAELENGDEENDQRPGITITEPKTPSKAINDFTHAPESFESYIGLSLGTSMNSASSTSATEPGPLLSFNVVFALADGKGSAPNIEVSSIHDHVVKKLSKALRYCQKHSNYVALQNRKLMALKTKAKQEGTSKAILCQQMLENCELAWVLKEVYENISIGATADIRLEGKEMSLFIPANPKIGEAEIDRNSGLLLLEDKEVLVREVSRPDGSALAYFLREHTPTKSLQKLANRLGMNVDHVLHLARYLVTWQKARAIAPLHLRNVYTVGPEAPLDRLQEHIAEYARLFPVLPPLPQVLTALSGKSVKYGVLLPSRDHREPFMAILAYLIQHRFVQQMKTSGWLQAPMASKKPTAEASVNQNRQPLSVASLLSPQLRPVDDDAASVSSERTAIPVSLADARKKRNIPSPIPPASVEAQEETSNATAMITSPLNPSEDDMLRLQCIRETVADAELAERLPVLLRYFDGEQAFEAIGAKEGLKRSKVDGWLDLLEEEGFLVAFRSL